MTNDFEFMHHITNVILDLGGVIAILHEDEVAERFELLGLENNWWKNNGNYFISRINRGVMSSDDFCMEIKSHCSRYVSDTDIRSAYESMLEVPRDTVLFVQHLPERYNTYLLSDISEIHWGAFKRLCLDHSVDVDTCFKKTYLSYKIGRTKPDPEVYQFVLSDADISPVETIYFDDNINNVKAGIDAGIYSYKAMKNNPSSWMQFFELMNSDVHFF